MISIKNIVDEIAVLFRISIKKNYLYLKKLFLYN